MYHLLISHNGWKGTESALSPDRIFEFTESHWVELFKPGGTLDMDQISKYPAVFASEINSPGDQVARIGYIQKVSNVGREVKIRYAFDFALPPVPNDTLKKLAAELEIQPSELRRTHWAIKDVDLFKVLHTEEIARGPSPTVFSFDDVHRVEDDLISVMMPFAPQFTPVYDALKVLTSEIGLQCLRADDFWEHAAVIQDIVALICRSRIVVCDCSGRNPNVFYEAGIAHSLGKDVIFIAQSADDIPFDLRHLRYVTYLNNGEGLHKLQTELSPKIKQLVGI